MKDTYCDSVSRYVTTVEQFTGYNNCIRCSSGEMFDMKNLSGDRYPFLSTRHRRGTFKSYTDIIDNVIVADVKHNGSLYTNAIVIYSASFSKIDILNSDYELITSVAVDFADSQKMVIMGGYLIMFPSGFYLNLFNPDSVLVSDRGYIGAKLVYDRPLPDDVPDSSVVGVTTFTECTKDGVSITIETTKPENPTSGTYWNDNGSLKVYSESDETWNAVATRYTKLYFPADSGVFYDDVHQFFEGDILNIGCLTDGGRLKEQTFQLVGFDSTANDSTEVEYIILQGQTEYSSLTSAQVFIERKIPNFDFIFEHNNRLWGCYYGIGEEGNVVNEIYASALGDFRNWYKYEGTAMDSWTASMGIQGKWTGAISYGGYPVFFKENAIIKVYGTAPSSYQTSVNTWHGVKDGSAESMAIVNEVLYYLSADGVVAYSGGVPQNIDEALHRSFEGAVGGGCKGKYYLYAGGNVFVYNTAKGLWHKEGAHKAVFFRSIGNNLLSVQSNGIKAFYGNDTADSIEWYCETANLGYGYADFKYVSRIQARINLEADHELRVYISYDDGDWEFVGGYLGNGVKPILCEVRPVRCDFFRLKFEGSGEADIISYTYLTEEGSSNDNQH